MIAKPTEKMNGGWTRLFFDRAEEVAAMPRLSLDLRVLMIVSVATWRRPHSISATEVAAAVGCTRQAAYDALRKLVASGLILHMGQRGRRYQVSPELCFKGDGYNDSVTEANMIRDENRRAHLKLVDCVAEPPEEYR